MSRPLIVIIADDLTGALDTAAPFATLGCRTVAAIEPDRLDEALRVAPEVLSVNLASRELPAAAARRRAAAVAEALAARVGPSTLLLKKIDSRLKGHLRVELEAFAAILAPTRIVVCPAIPELGRIVRDGALQGRGVAAPVPVAESFAGLVGPEPEFADAATDVDLDRLVAKATGRTLYVGARGLGAALARRLGAERAARRSAVPDFRGPMAFVVGSRDPITLEQVDRLRASAEVTVVPAPNGEVPARPVSGAVVLQAVAGDGHPADGAAVVARLAAGLVSHYLDGRRTLLLTGGETAAAVLSALDAATLEVLGEALPGLPVCRPLDSPSRLSIITKSGGFGDADCLISLLHRSHPAA